jgi:UBX domain-containing protein 1
MIDAGSAPIHILNVSPNQEVDLTLQNRKDEKYVQPKAKYRPFSGQGQRLGSPTPGPAIGHNSSAEISAGVSAGPSSSATQAAPQMDVDASQPTVSIQFRLGDGTRLPARFNHSHTVADLYDFVNRARSNERAYVLMTTFPTKELEDKTLKISDIDELRKGGVVVQKWK